MIDENKGTKSFLTEQPKKSVKRKAKAKVEKDLIEDVPQENMSAVELWQARMTTALLAAGDNPDRKTEAKLDKLWLNIHNPELWQEV